MNYETYQMLPPILNPPSNILHFHRLRNHVNLRRRNNELQKNVKMGRQIFDWIIWDKKGSQRFQGYGMGVENDPISHLWKSWHFFSIDVIPKNVPELGVSVHELHEGLGEALGPDLPHVHREHDQVEVPLNVVHDLN